MRAMLLPALSSYISLLGKNGPILSCEDAAEAKKYGMVTLKCNAWLCDDSTRKNLFLWRLRQKDHYWQHTLMDLPRSRMNPLWFDTLREEDFLGKWKRSGQRTDPRSSSKLIYLAAASAKSSSILQFPLPHLGSPRHSRPRSNVSTGKARSRLFGPLGPASAETCPAPDWTAMERAPLCLPASAIFYGVTVMLVSVRSFSLLRRAQESLTCKL